MNALLVAAGTLLFVAAAVHGIAGETLVVRKLRPGSLPSTRFGGPSMTMTMIRASWHLTTIGFLAAGAGLVLSGSVLEGDTARGVALAAAGAATGFAAVVTGGALARSPRTFFRHPAPLLLSAVAALAWLGIA
jgi:hypothetical protein